MKDIDLQIKVTYNGLTATVEGQMLNNNGFTPEEIRSMLASILQNLTNTGDGYGNPIIENIQINGNNVTGSQQRI